MSNRIPLGFFAFSRGEYEGVSRACITVPCLLGTSGRCYFLDLLDVFQFIFMEVGETRYINGKRVHLLSQSLLIFNFFFKDTIVLL